mmetsp:Transcript_23917/g.43889  ORF Transcript_23917/g.43889 Transcript_23917/m.43889 type:complete len:632 (+) Transcript_23917:15-1910(+)
MAALCPSLASSRSTYPSSVFGTWRSHRRLSEASRCSQRQVLCSFAACIAQSLRSRGNARSSSRRKAVAMAAMGGKFDFEFNSRRGPVFASRGMVATSQPLASEAGLRTLQAGGTAADACVAAAAALNVTEPCSTGIGGDALALFYDAASGQVKCLQSCGRSAASMTLAAVKALPVMNGRRDLPPNSALCVNVPGAAAAWEAAVSQWGKLPLAQVLRPAIELAEDGFPVQPAAAHGWACGEGDLREAAKGKACAFLPGGCAPKAGEIFRNPDLASTFKLLGEKGSKEGFYKGRVAKAIVAACKAHGGFLEESDLEAHTAVFPEAISTSYRGKVRMWQCPPPTQGITALMALDLLEQEALQSRLGAACVHAQAEALRFAFADALQWCGDPSTNAASVQSLLDKKRVAERWKQYYKPTSRAAGVTPRTCEQISGGPDTVYLCAVDRWGNGCSFINSNYMGFGTGIVPDGCGFSLQNRGHNFILREGHPNCLAPGKMSYTTIIPGLVTWEGTGKLFGPMGVMGGFMQPQGHLQVLSAMVDYGLDPQAALNQPRFCLAGVSSELGPECIERAGLLMEEGFSAETIRELQGMGHECTVVSGWSRAVFGRGQIICRDPESGVLVGGTEPRADGVVAAW